MWFFYFCIMIRVLFVCLGNICRSPLAEGIFKKMIEENNFQHRIACDSAGTASYHVGKLADIRTRKNAHSHGIDLTHRARAFHKSDFNEFHYIIPMDESNLKDINLLKPESINSKIMMMRDFDMTGKGLAVPDPYYGNDEDFENVFQILKRSNGQFIQYLIKTHSIQL